MSNEPPFRADSFITILVLVCFTGLIILLLVLEEVGYIYRDDDTFKNEKDTTDWNFGEGTDTRPIDFTKENPEESTVPAPLGTHTEETLKNKGSKTLIGKLGRVYSAVYEITDADMDKILDSIKKGGLEFPYKKATGGNSSVINKEEILNRFLIEFTSSINKEVLDRGLNKEHPDVFFRIKGYEFKHDKSHKNQNQTILVDPPEFRSFEVIPMDAELDPSGTKRFNMPDDLAEYNTTDIANFSLDTNKIYIMIGRPGTYQDFTVYANFNIQDTDEKVIVKFNTLKVYGVINKEVNEGVSGVFSSKMNHNNDRKESSIPDKYFQVPYKQKFVDDYVRKLAHDKWIGDHKCFVLINEDVNHEIKGVNNQLFCESYHPEFEQVGVWDAPCQEDEECPYYQANKNYDNDYGGCDQKTGKCEMPFGVKRIGYKRTDKSDPMCYNCGKDGAFCCEEQKNDTTKKSPDYVFMGDLDIRELQTETLRKNGCPSSLLG